MSLKCWTIPFLAAAILVAPTAPIDAQESQNGPPQSARPTLEAILSDPDLDMADESMLARVRQLGHQAVDLESRFPSANSCGSCHPDQFREWSVSQHAYAQMSPVFNAMHGTILKLTNGTNGDFCIRCHTPVGMNLGEPVFMSNMDRNPTSREGVTCIACHRLEVGYSKVSGRLAIAEGDIFDPVFGPNGNEELQRVINSDEFSVNEERGQSGRAIHGEVKVLDQISTSGFCATCHDVNLVNGFRLEEAFSEYKSSPAAAQGISCQDCHMGIEPGKNSGYAEAPAAVIGGRPTAMRKRTNHMFAGPDYSIIHPGIFPHNIRASEMASIREWLTFDVDAGWGTETFESAIPSGTSFPDRWNTADDRYDARDIIDTNLELLSVMDTQRLQVLRAGYAIGEVVIHDSGSREVEFDIEVKNVTNGHNVPTGFDAERLVFLQVTVRDAAGEIVFVSGDRDPNGDVRDLHSLYVHDGELPLDKFLFSLQSKFLVRMNRGGEREQVLALNYSPDPLPFLRPSTRATALLARPVGARKHRATIPPLKSNWAKYRVDDDALRGSQGPYTAEVKLVSQMIPVNLIHEIKGVGFDYYMSPRAVADAVVEGAQILWERTVELN